MIDITKNNINEKNADKESLLKDLKKLEKQMEDMYRIERKIDNLKSQRDDIHLWTSVILYIALVILLAKPLEYLDISRFFFWVIRLVAPFIIIPVFFKWIINGIVSLLTSQEKNHLLEEYEQKWPSMARVVYQNNILPSQYMHLDYVRYLVNLIEFCNVDNLHEATQRLEEMINEIVARERSNGMVSLEKGIHKEMEDLTKQLDYLQDLERLSKKDQRKTQEIMRWVSKKPSCFRDQEYLYKFIKNK